MKALHGHIRENKRLNLLSPVPYTVQTPFFPPLHKCSQSAQRCNYLEPLTLALPLAWSATASHVVSTIVLKSDSSDNTFTCIVFHRSVWVRTPASKTEYVLGAHRFSEEQKLHIYSDGWGTVLEILQLPTTRRHLSPPEAGRCAARTTDSRSKQTSQGQFKTNIHLDTAELFRKIH